MTTLTNQQKLDRNNQILEAVDVQVNAKDGALQALRKSLNTAGPAGLIACQGDVNIILARLDALTAAITDLKASIPASAPATGVAGVTATNTLDPATVTAIAEAVFQRLKAQVDKP